MRIAHIMTGGYIQNKTVSRPMKTISFGEIDGAWGDVYSRSHLTEEQKAAEREKINNMYDKRRSSYLSDADDLGFAAEAVEEELDRIERMRAAELADYE